MGYLGYKPADKPLTSADITDSVITSAKIVDGTIANADINSSAAIALSKLSTTGTASSANFLRGDGAWTAVSSDFVLLASTVTSSASSVSFDGYFSSTYDNYVVYINGYGCATDGSVPRVRFRRSNADVSASNYIWTTGRIMRSSGSSDISQGDTAWNDNFIGIMQDMDNDTVTNGNYIIQIPNPLSTTVYPSIIFDGTATNNTNSDYYRRFGFGRLTSTGALSGITFFQSSGNMSGRFKLYGIKA